MKRPRTRAEALALKPVLDIEPIRERVRDGYDDGDQLLLDVEALLREVDRRGDMILSWMKLYEAARWPPTPAPPLPPPQS